MPAPYGDGLFLNEPPAGNGLNITDLFHIVVPKPEDPGINSKVDSKYPNVAIITFDTSNQFGGMWAKEQLDLTMPFSTEIYLHLGRQYDKTNTNIADGMTFTLHNDPAGLNAIGGAGEGLGVYKGRKFDNRYWQGNPVTVPHGTFLKNSLVIEFDTYRNIKSTETFVDDPSAPHCALLIPRADTISVGSHVNTFSFPHSQQWVKFEVSWLPNSTGGGMLNYTFNGISKTYTVNNIISTFGGTKVWWGFTGATGQLTSVQAAAITRLPLQGIIAEKTVKNAAGEDINHGHALPGDTLIYTVRVTAQTLSASIGPVIIKDKISEFVEYTETYASVRTSTGDTFDIPTSYSAGTLTVETTRYLYTEGDWIEVTFSVNVRENTSGETVYNQSIVRADGLSEEKETNITDVIIFSEPEKRVLDSNNVDINNKPVKAGDQIIYEISYANNDDSLIDITITDRLPDGVDFVSATDSGAYDNGTHTVTWRLTDVPRITGTVSAVVVVNEHAMIQIENSAEVTIDDDNPQVTNSVMNPVVPEEPVKKVSNDSEAGKDGSAVRVGDKITYEISYFNYSAEDAVIVITDKLPTGVDFVSAGSGGTHDPATHTVTWTLSNVPSGYRGIVSVVVQVNASAVIIIENYAAVQVEDNAPQVTNSVVNPISGPHCTDLKQVTECRKTIEGQKIWIDDNNIGGTRPPSVEIILKRDGEVYKSVSLSSTGDGAYSFGCLPIWKNPRQKYDYQIDEAAVPEGYTKTIEGYDVINTLNPQQLTEIEM